MGTNYFWWFLTCLHFLTQIVLRIPYKFPWKVMLTIWLMCAQEIQLYWKNALQPLFVCWWSCIKCLPDKLNPYFQCSPKPWSNSTPQRVYYWSPTWIQIRVLNRIDLPLCLWPQANRGKASWTEDCNCALWAALQSFTHYRASKRLYNNYHNFRVS